MVQVKKILAWVVTIVLLLSVFPAMAEEEVSKYDKLTVTVTTPFSGNFFSDVLGSNISDQDVRKLIHGYNLVYWDNETGSYQFNPKLIGATSLSEDGTSYILAIMEGLTYNDGTPITAKDYAFSLLLQGSSELKEATGNKGDLSRIWGGRDYQDGKVSELKGVRLLGDHQIALTVDPDFVPYFYQLKALDISPMPISVIAPGCDVKDNGNGAYIDGDFSAELLEETLLDPLSGYMSHPTVTSGPYQMTNYDEKSVTLALNPQYEGDENGVVPTIPQIVIQVGNTDTVISDLAGGKTDLVVRCVRQDQIMAGMQLAATDDFGMKAYSRNGLSFISFCAEKGATSDPTVRQALAMCIDKTALTEQYSGQFGMAVDGFYGIGQWMYLMANGTMVPEEGAEEEWADLNLDGITKYEFNPSAAAKLLEENGWEMDRDGVLSKAIDGQDIHLSLKLIYPEGNGVGPMLDQVFIPYLNEAGIELETEAMPMPELLKKYYGQEERDCDMILLGTNFNDVYDPTGEYDDNGTSYLNGITNPELRELAINLRSTEPGNATEFCRRWLRYQEKLAEIITGIPLYSDAYLDFHISALQNYEPGKSGNWATAVAGAILSDYVPEEEPEEGTGEDLELEGEELENLEDFE
jgi:ABC-type transport system substrate-binding protein